MKLKSKKSALLLSFTSLLLCFAMLAGSTFAWFTDTATTGVNKITSGNLHVEIQNKAGTKIEKLEWVTKEGTAIDKQDDILWEPGCTYLLTPFKIVNTGNLALKYKIVITGLDGDSPLLDVIKFTYKVGGVESLLNEEGHLTAKGTAGASTDMITVSAHMDETANNDYQDKTLENVKFTVYATQDTVENDSYGPTYDKNATYYPVLDAAGLKDALVNGGEIQVVEDVRTSGEDTVEARMTVSKPTTLQLDKKIISPDNMGNNEDNFVALIVDADTTINAGPEGGIDTGTNGGYAINVRNGAKLTINSGDYYGGGTAVQVQEGELIINGGFFAVEPYSNPTYGYNFLLNCIDGNYKNGTAKIIVKGGTFVNFDPSNNTAEGAGTNFVADGYSVISEQHGADTWYTVVRAADSEDTLKAAIEEGAPYIQLTGDISICENGSVAFDKDFVLDGNGHSVYAKEQLKILGGDVVFRDVTFSSPRALFVKGANFVMEETATIESEVDGNAAIWLYGNANAEIRGTVIAPKAYGICVNRAETDAPNMVKIDGAKVESWGPALYVNGSWGGHEVSAVHSTFTNTNGQCVYISGANGEGKGQTVTLIDCTIEGTTAVEVKHSDVKLTGCTLTATGDPTSYTENNNGGTALGYCFATTSNSKGEKIDPTSGTIEFENCTFNPKVSGCEVFNSYANESGNRGATINGYENSKILYPAKLTPNP